MDFYFILISILRWLEITQVIELRRCDGEEGGGCDYAVRFLGVHEKAVQKTTQEDEN